MSVVGRLRIAPGADRAASAFSWAWEDITADTASPTTEIRAGRSDEAGQTAPKTATWLLHNGADRDHRYTPGHPLSDLTNFGQGTPIEYAVQAGDPYLWATGNTNSGITTPDHASLRVTGAHWAGVEIEAPAALGKTPDSYAIFGRSDAATNDISWMLLLLNTGHLWLAWSPDGTPGALGSAISTVPVPRPAAGPMSFAWWFRPNNGAGGNTTHFYAGRMELEDLRQAVMANDPTVNLGDTVTGAGTTSVHAGTQHMFLGGEFNSGGPEFPGRIRAATFRDATVTCTLLANPIPADRAAGDTTWADDAATPKTWTLSGDAYITDYRTRFLGEITAVNPHAPGHGVSGTQMARVEAQAVRTRDRLREKAVKSILYRVAAAQDPATMIGWWPMEETAGAGSFASPLEGVQPMGIGPPGVAQLATDDELAASLPLPHIPASTGWGYTAKVPARPGITNYRATIFLNVPTLTTTGPQEIFTLRTSGTVAQWRFFLDDTSLIFQGFNSSNTITVNPGGSTALEWDDGWVQLTLGIEQDGANIDWAVAWLAASGNAYGFTGTIAGTIGVPTAIAGLFSVDGDGLSLGHATITTDLAASWLGWNDGARLAYIGEEDWERVRRLADERGDWTAAHTGQFAEVTAELGPQRPRKYIDLLAECEAAGLGLLSDHPVEFGYHYRTRSSLYNQAARWTVDTGVVMPFAPAHDLTRLLNEVTVTRTEGGEAFYEDLANIAVRGRVDAAPTLNVADEDTLYEIASWLVFLGTWPEMRFAAWTIALTKNPALVDGWLGMALGDILELSAAATMAPWLGQPTVRQLLQGYTETISPGDPGVWEVRANGSPADPYTVGVVEDDVMGRLATDGSSLDAAIDDNDLTGTVDITDGPLWITTALHPTEFPFDITIDYEDLTVSAISGTSSPQTFTWTRAANGTTAAAHDAGAAVQVRQPIRLAL